MKNLGKLAIMAALMLFAVTFAYAQDNAQATKKQTQSAVAGSGNFVDKNKDGVCDNNQSKTTCGKCTGFVDKNGDGKCDNCTGTGNCKGKQGGCGQGDQLGKGKGNCGTGCSKQKSKGCCPGAGKQSTGDKK